MEHLILEVLACAADEVASSGRAGRGVVTLYADGSLSVADDGRGSDTRVDGTTGTTVLFQPDVAIPVGPGVVAVAMSCALSWPHLRVELVDER